MRKLTLAGVVVVVVLILSVGWAVKANSQAADLDDQERAAALSTVRMLNTYQVTYKVNEGQGRYGSFADLAASEGFQKNIEAMTRNGRGLVRVDASRYNLLSEENFLPGWKLSQVVSPDGLAYKLSLIRVGDECRFGFFTDQVGIIYKGTVINCPE